MKIHPEVEVPDGEFCYGKRAKNFCEYWKDGFCILFKKRIKPFIKCPACLAACKDAEGGE